MTHAGRFAVLGPRGEFAHLSRDVRRFTGALAQRWLIIDAPMAVSAMPPGFICVTEMKSVLLGSARFGRMILVAMRISARTYLSPRLGKRGMGKEAKSSGSN